MPALTAANDLIRSQNVSASEVGALLDGHPYATPEGIWDRLCAPEGIVRRESEAMSLGSFFEPVILRYAERRDGFRARLNGATLEHPKVRLCATPDGYVTRAMPWALVPERALVEIKMSGRPEIWRDVPSYVEWQARAQLAVTRRDVVYIYVLVGMALLRHAVWRDIEKEERLLVAVERFWTDHVVARVRPEPAPPAELLLDFGGRPPTPQEVTTP